MTPPLKFCFFDFFETKKKKFWDKMPTKGLIHEGKTKLFNENRTEIFDLAYAITVHKSQGSEYANVLMPIVDDHRIMLTRKLIYTAITRGKQKVCLIGSKKIFCPKFRNFLGWK